MKNKKAVSPVISTVLLIMLVIIIAIIILLWSRSWFKEALIKEIAGESKRVQDFCYEVNLKSTINEDEFGFTNAGNVPIYAINLKTVEKGTGNSEVTKINAPDGTVNPGKIKILPGRYSDYEEVIIIPILLAKSQSGEIQPFECPEENSFKI